MPLEDEIIPDNKQEAKRGDGLQNFLDSAQGVLAEVVAKNAAEKVVDGMFSPGNRGGIPSDGPPQEGIYPDLDRGNNQNKERSFMDNAQNAFADAFAKRAAEKLVDGILPSNNMKQPEGHYGAPSQGTRPQGSDHSGFDLGSLGSSLLESFADQVFHPSDKQNPQHQSHNQPQAQGQSGFDLGSVGSELLSSLADQVLHPNKASQDQQQHSSARAAPVQSDNQSGFDLGKVGTELLGSLAEQVLHPSNKKDDIPVQQHPTGPHGNPNANQTGGGDIGSILGSLAENVLGGVRHNPQNQSQDSSTKPHTFADSAGDIASSVLGSLADSVLHKNSNNDPQQYQGPSNYGPFPQGPGPQWYGPGPQGYGPGPQGYGPGPQGYGPGPQGYGPGPQGYGPGPQGYGPGPQGYGPDPQGYWPGPQGYGPPPQGYGQQPQGYWPDSQNQQNPKDEGSPGIGSLLLNSVADAVKNNPSPDQDHRRQRKQPEEDESPAAELGSFLVNSLATKMLQPHPQQ